MNFKKIPFTKSHLKKYKDSDYLDCFICGGKLDGSEEFDMFTDMVKHFLDCDECKTKFTEIFIYRDREELNYYTDEHSEEILKGYKTNECHKCGSTKTTPYTDMDYITGEEVSCRVHCEECDTHWTAYYKLKTIEDLEVLMANSVDFIQDL